MEGQRLQEVDTGKVSFYPSQDHTVVSLFHEYIDKIKPILTDMVENFLENFNER